MVIYSTGYYMFIYMLNEIWVFTLIIRTYRYEIVGRIDMRLWVFLIV